MKTHSLKLLLFTSLAVIGAACTQGVHPSVDTYLLGATGSSEVQAPFTIGYVPDDDTPIPVKFLIDGKKAIFGDPSGGYDYIPIGFFGGALPPGTHTFGIELQDGTQYWAAAADFQLSPQSQTDEKATSVFFMGHSGAMKSVVRSTDDDAVTSGSRILVVNASPMHTPLSVSPCQTCAVSTLQFGEQQELLVPDGDLPRWGFEPYLDAQQYWSTHRDSVAVQVSISGGNPLAPMP